MSKEIDEQNKNQNEKEQLVDIIKKVSEYANKDFVQFSAIVTVIFTCGIWGIRSVWYAFCSGRFSVYNIDNCYINSDSNNTFLQLIMVLSIIVLFVGLNYLYYKLSMREDKSKFAWRRKAEKLIFWIMEMLILFSYLIVQTNVSVKDLIREGNVKYFFGMFIALFVICFNINLIGIECVWSKKSRLRHEEKEKRTKNEKDEEFKWEYKKSLRLGIFAVFAIAVGVLSMYINGIICENSRTEYKVIICEVAEKLENKYCFSDEDKDVSIYPIVYENEDCYILSRIYNENGEIKLDYDYQQIVSKENQETYMISNIYEINVE